EGNLISCSQDTTIKVFDVKTGMVTRVLSVHGHWVNHVALNTEYVLRTGPFAPDGPKEFTNREQMVEIAKKRYEEILKQVGGERLLSCSDDATMALWNNT